MAAKIPAPIKQKEFKTIDKHTSGLVYDAVDHIYYVSSSRTGAIGKYTPDGKYEMLYNDNDFKMSSALKITPDGKTLYFCIGEKTSDANTTSESSSKTLRLIGIDAKSGKKLSETELSNLSGGNHFASDLTFDSSGNIYIADHVSNAIYKVTANGKASLFAKSDSFSETNPRLNSIVWHPDGFLLTNNSSGTLFKIDILNPENIQKVSTSNISLNADGLLLSNNNTLTLLQNNNNSKVYQLVSNDNWKSAIVNTGIFAESRVSNHKEAWVLNPEIWQPTQNIGKATNSEL
ncbi:hypothetical protein FNO01nite_08100 [Flavobacterium noncentrifugens]|nr:hypothetical protein FNO01nite_08100 [Flavobacterium noncentrifugens]